MAEKYLPENIFFLYIIMHNPDVMAYYPSSYRDWHGQVLLTNLSVPAQSYKIPCPRTQNRLTQY